MTQAAHSFLLASAAPSDSARSRPRDLRMDPPAQAAISSSDDVLAADDIGEDQDAIRHQLGVLDDIGLRGSPPGMRILPAGNLMSRQILYSCSWRTLPASISTPAPSP